MDYIIWIVCLFWIVCGIISYGLDFAYFQRKYPTIAQQEYTNDKKDCIFWAVFGPINLLTVIIRNDYSYGFKLK